MAIRSYNFTNYTFFIYLQVALIFGITGACRRQELNDITTKDVEKQGELAGYHFDNCTFTIVLKIKS